MAEILEKRTCMLQVNTDGSWRDVLSFEPYQRAQILASVPTLALALGEAARWCLHHPNGNREWLHEEDLAMAAGWLTITDDEPAPLVDVLVSAYDAWDREGLVFMAWRDNAGAWIISGSDEALSLPVYAYQPVMAPAPAPAALQVAA